MSLFGGGWRACPISTRQRDFRRPAGPLRDLGAADLAFRQVVLPVRRVFLQTELEFVSPRHGDTPTVTLARRVGVAMSALIQRLRRSFAPGTFGAIEPRWPLIPDTLGAALHATSTLSLNCIRLAHRPCGLHEPLLDHADESDT